MKPVNPDFSPSATIHNGKVVVSIRRHKSFQNRDMSFVYQTREDEDPDPGTHTRVPSKEETEEETLRDKLFKLQFENGTLRLPKVEVYQVNPRGLKTTPDDVMSEDGATVFRTDAYGSSIAGELARRVTHPRSLKL